MKSTVRVVLSPLAARDMEFIGDYIAKDSPKRAQTFVAELRAVSAKIANEPQAFRHRPELGVDIRSYAHGNDVIFFQTGARQVRIVRVLHGAMDLPAQFADEQIGNIGG